MRFGKRAVSVTAAGLLAALAMTGCSGSIDTNEVVATIGGEEMTLGVANFCARMMQGEYETYYSGMLGMTPDTMWTQKIDDDTTYEESVKDNVLESLENMYVISLHASDYDVKLTDDEKDAITAVAEQFDKDNTDEAKEAVSGYKKDIEKFLELSSIRSKMDSKMKEGVDENVTDEEAAQKSMQYVFFSYTSTDDSGNSKELSDDEKKNLMTSAKNLKSRTDAGEDFETVASEIGADVETATFDSESTSPDADLITAADALDTVGQVTDPVETDSGIYVAKLTSLLDREATDNKKTTIVEERRQEQYDSLLEDWRDAADIKVNKKVWNKVDFEDLGITITTSENTSSDTSGSADGGTSADTESSK